MAFPDAERRENRQRGMPDRTQMRRIGMGTRKGGTQKDSNSDRPVQMSEIRGDCPMCGSRLKRSGRCGSEDCETNTSQEVEYLIARYEALMEG